MKKKTLLTLIIIIFIVATSLLLFACQSEAKIDALQLVSFGQSEYNQGDPLAFEGSSLIIRYQNGTEEKVMIDSSMISSYDPNKLGEQYVIVSYKGKSVAYKVVVNKPRIATINIDLKPENVNYIEGQNFNPRGAELVVTYENEQVERIPLENHMVTGFDKNLVGTQSLVVKYRENFASGDYKDHFLNVQVTVSKKEIQSIEVFQSPRITTYFLGADTPSFDGGVLLVKYNNRYTDKVNFVREDDSNTLIENLSYTWNSLVASESTFINLTYYDEQNDVNHETRFAIKVRERNVKEYKFLDAANNSIGESLSLTQVQNSEFDFGNYKIQIEYNDEQTYETIALAESPERYVITEYNDQSFITQTSYLQIKYSGIVLKRKIPIKVTVIPEVVSSINLNVPINLYVDTVINYKFWTFCYVYNSGNVSELNEVAENIEISYRKDNVLHKFSDLATVTFAQAGQYQIVAELSADSTITYVGEMEIKPMAIDTIELVGAPMLEAYYGDVTVDPKDTKIKVKYKNGLYKNVEGSQEIQVTSDMITFDSSISGNSQATITYVDSDYNNISGSVEIDIEIKNKIPEIEITNDPKLTYFINEEFNYSNMSIKFKYASDTTTEITRQGLAITNEGFYFSIEGQSEEFGLSFVNEGAVVVYLNHSGMIDPIPIPVTVIKTPIEIGYLFYQGYNEENEFVSEPRGNAFGDVIEGLDVNLDNLYIEIKFEGSNEFENIKLTKEMLSYRKEDTTLGNRLVSITYPFDADASSQIVGHGYTVNVIEKEVVALTIPQGSEPRMREYTRSEIVGATEEFVYFGLRIIKIYSNGTTEEIDLNNSEFDFARVPLNVPTGTDIDIKISYLFDANVFVFYTVTVVEQTIQEVKWDIEANTNVAWYNEMPTVYVTEGQEIDFMNLYAELTGAGGLATSFDHLKIIELETGGDSRSEPYSIAKNHITQVLDYQKEQGPGEQFVKLLYKGKELGIHVIVKSSVLYAIEIDEENIDKIQAIAGGDLIIDDTYFIAVYRAEGAVGEGHGQSTEKRSFVKLELSHIQKSENNPNGYDKTDATLNERNVTIYYLGKTVQFEINVVEKEVESIIIGSLFKNAFVEGEAFSYVSADNPSVYPTLQVNYTNGQTNGIVYHEEGEDIIVFPTVYELVQEGSLVIDYSSFDSSDFDGAPKTQTIKLVYTSTYGVATYSYNVVVYNKKTALFGITIPYPSGKNSFIYGEASEPTFSVTGYSAVLTADGLEDNSSPADTTLTKGSLHSGNVESGFYYVFYIPSHIFVSTDLVYQTLFDKELTENNLLHSPSTQCIALREYTKFPANVGTYKIVVRSFGDAVHNSFIYDYRNRTDIKDLVILQREIYIKVAAKSQIYGDSTPQGMLIELRTSPTASILDNPMEVFAQQDRALGFRALGFTGTNVQIDKTLVQIANNNGGVLDGSDTYDCFDITYATPQGPKRALAFNEAVANYTVTINPVLENPNYNLIYIQSSFNVIRRKVNVYPKIMSGVLPTWQHGQPRPSIEYDTSKLSEQEAADAGVIVDDTGLLYGDVLDGRLGAKLNLEEDILSQLSEKAADDPDNVIGYTQITNGTLTNNANRNYEIILKNHAMGTEDEVLVKYLKRTIYIKVKSQVRVYGSSWQSSNLNLIFTKQAAGDTTDEDAFAPISGNQRETLSDIGTLKYSYYQINPLTYQETLIAGITSNLQIGSVAIYLSIDQQGEKFELYDVQFVKGEVKTTKRSVLIVPLDTTKTFGDNDPDFAFETKPVDGESQSGLLPTDNLLGEGKLARAAGEGVGRYKILLGTLAQNNSNYHLILGKNATTNVDSVLIIETKKIYVGFSSELSKEYDGLEGSISKSSMNLYSKDSNNNYIEENDFDKNKISLLLRQKSKNVGSYDIEVSSFDPNYQIFLRDTAVSYKINQRAVEVQLLNGENLVENNSSLEYATGGYTLHFSVKPEQLAMVYDENGEPILEGGQPKLDVVSVQLTATVNGEQILGSTITDIGAYTLTPISTLSNNNYKLIEPIETYHIQVVAKTLFVKLKNANVETHLVSREYNGRPIEIMPQDYDVIPYVAPSLRPTLSLGIIGESEPPRNVLIDLNGDILSYDIGIIQNSNNPNYIYELYYQDYEYQIIPKVVVLQISSNNLQQSYNGMTPFIREFNITGAVQGEVLNNENIHFSFTREANDNRANSDSGRYQVAASSLNPNYSINLHQDYVFTILPTTSIIRLNKTNIYDPLKRELMLGNTKLPFLLETDFIFNETNPPKIRNFVGEASKTDHVEKLSFLTNGVSRVRSAFFALNMQSSKEALENGINIFKTAIDEMLNSDKTAIKYASHLYFEDISGLLFNNLDTLASRIDEISAIYNSGYTAMKQKFDELLSFVNVLSSTMDQENNYISFTFNEADWPEGDFVVNQILNFEFESHGYNTVYIWEQNSFVTIIKRHLLLKVQDIEKKYGEIQEEAQINVIYQIFDSKGSLITSGVSLIGHPSVLNFNRNCGTYNISIDQMIVDNSGSYLISLHPETTNPKFRIVKNKITVVMLDVGTEGDLIYGTTIATSTINSYRLLDIFEGVDKGTAIDFYKAYYGTPEDPSDAQLLEFFGKPYFGDEIGSSYTNSVINTSSAVHHLYLESEYEEGIYNDKLGLSNLDSDDYIICAENYFSTNYEVRILSGLLRISRATANLEVQAGNNISRKYSETFKFTFHFPSLPLGVSADLMLNKLDNVTGDLTPIGLISESSNIFIDLNQTTAPELTDLHTKVSVDLSDYKLYLTNMYEGSEIVTKNYKFSFDISGYSVQITPKEIYLTITDMSDKQNMVVEYGTFDNPLGHAGSNNNNYKITYEGFASWDIETLNPSVDLQPGEANAPKFNLYSVASTIPKVISISDMTWDALSSHNVLENYTAIVVEGSTLVTNKKQVQIEIDPDKLKTAFKFYTYSPLSGTCTFSNMMIYPYLSETVALYNETPGSEKLEYESYKIIGGTYGPMDFRFKDGSQAAYQEQLHSSISDVLHRGEFNLNIVPYVGSNPPDVAVGSDTRKTIREVNKKETLFNHKITVAKIATGWRVTVSNFSPTSNYTVDNQVVEFSDAEVKYVYQVIDIVPSKKNIFYNTNYSDWQTGNRFPFYVFDTSVSQQTYNQYLSNGFENYNISEDYTFNLGNKPYPNNLITIQSSPSPNALNTMYSVLLKYTSAEHFDDSVNLVSTADYADYFKVTSTTEGNPVTVASNKRQEHLANKFEKQKSLPLIFKEQQSLTMQDMELKEYVNSDVPYGFERLEHAYEGLNSSYDTYNEAYDFVNSLAIMKVYDKLSVSFRAKKIDEYKTSTSLAFVLSHTSTGASGDSVQYPEYQRTAKHSVLMFRMNPNSNLNSTSKYYLDNGIQAFSLEFLVYYEVSNDQIEIVEAFSSSPVDAPTIFDGYLHTFNFFHDKANMMIYVDIDNSHSSVISLNSLAYQGIGASGEVIFNILESIEPQVAYPGPVKIGVLSANLDIDIRRMSSANQGFYEVSGSKLILSSDFKHVTKNVSMPYANVIDLGLISQDVVLKYYLNGIEQSSGLTAFDLLLGSNKLEVYAYYQGDLIDRLITYAYYYPATYPEMYKFADYRVIYTKDLGSTESITIGANSFYFDGDTTLGKSQTMLDGRYDNFMNFLIGQNGENGYTPLIYYYDNPEDIEGTKVLINGKPEFVTPAFNVIEPMRGDIYADPYGYNEAPGQDTGRLFKFEPFDTNIKSVSMTFKLFETLNLISADGSRELLDSDSGTPGEYDGGFQVVKELTKVAMRLFYNSSANRSILITNQLENPGIYYEEGLGNLTLIHGVTFAANKDYRISLLKDTTGTSILLYEDGSLIYKSPLDINKMSLMGNKFETKLVFGRAIIKDVAFNYTHDLNQDRLIKHGLNFINALEETEFDASVTPQEIEEFRQIPERNILESGYANLKYKYDNAGASAKSIISIFSPVNEHNLTFEISNSSLDFTYKGESSNSVVQSEAISLSENTEYAIKISLGEQTTVDSASLPIGLVNVSSGLVDCVPVYFEINGVIHTFYMPDKGVEQSSWIEKYAYSNASCYVMKMTFDGLVATVSDFGMYRQRNFDFVGYTLSNMPLNELP